MPEMKIGKHVILIIKTAASFHVCMKPIHRAESIKYIILVSITPELPGMSEYTYPRASGIIIAQDGQYQNLLFFSEIKN
jgi:hypothetical protein